jgi:signal transduction histidine kinase
MWSRLTLKTKILASSLVVAAASTGALIISLLGATWLFAVWPPGNNKPLWVVLAAIAAIAAIVSLVGAVTALLVSRWLFVQIAMPLRQASSFAWRLAKGHFADRMPDDGRLPQTHEDELRMLANSMDDLAASLQAAEQRRIELFGEITHELRTPVAVLEGYLEGLLDGYVKPAGKTWAMLYDEASRVHRLVDELQALARAETRQEPPDLQAVNPGAIALAALERLQLHFDEKGLQVVTDIARNLPLVLADPDHTIQVLVNLLTNALRYTPVPGTVILSVKRLTDTPHATNSAAQTGADEVVFSVMDTGIGIAAEHIPHLFERFFRVDRSGGSGIGLPVARALVEAMGGRIWAESPGLGKGSTFSFTLLVAPAPMSA